MPFKRLDKVVHSTDIAEGNVEIYTVLFSDPSTTRVRTYDGIVFDANTQDLAQIDLPVAV